MRQAAELKTSQPIFPGQPPPLARVDHNKQNYSQPPPRQSSQVPQRSSSTSVNRTAFPGQAPPGVATSTSSAASNFREPLFQVILLKNNNFLKKCRSWTLDFQVYKFLTYLNLVNFIGF